MVSYLVRSNELTQVRLENGCETDVCQCDLVLLRKRTANAGGEDRNFGLQSDVIGYTKQSVTWHASTGTGDDKCRMPGFRKLCSCKSTLQPRKHETSVNGQLIYGVRASYVRAINLYWIIHAHTHTHTHTHSNARAQFSYPPPRSYLSLVHKCRTNADKWLRFFYISKQQRQG